MMHVHECMTGNPVTISSQTSCSDAFRLMREDNIDWLPVVDPSGALAGIVTESDLLYSWPLSAALLSIHELDGVLNTMPVDKIMTREVIWIAEDCPLEEAARILIDKRINRLPVMRSGQLVGTIGKTDIFQAMMEALGGRAAGLRVTIRLCRDDGQLGAITDEVIHLGGKLLSLTTFWGGDPFKQMIVLKLEIADPQALLWMLEKTIGVQVIDVRKSGSEYQVMPSPGYREVFQMEGIDRHVELSTDPG